MASAWARIWACQSRSGVIHSYSDLLALVRARMTALGITFATLDEVTGVPRLFCEVDLQRPAREAHGPGMFMSIMGALGIELRAFEVDRAIERLRPRLVKRRLPRAARHWRHPTSATA